MKDRAALNMIREGERTGALRPGKTVLDATSGNTGIAYAMIGAALGYPIQLCLPANASAERKRILSAYGAKIVLTSADEGSDGAIRRAREIYAASPEKYFYPDQYSNAANWQAHYQTTAPEIWEQTGGRVTHFVAGMGTSGTFVGTARRLKELNPAIRCISLQPDSSFHGLEGWKHMGSALVPKIYDSTVADADLYRRDRRRLPHGQATGARREAMLVSPEFGRRARGLHATGGFTGSGERAVIVTIFPDAAEKVFERTLLWTKLWRQHARVVHVA